MTLLTKENNKRQCWLCLSYSQQDCTLDSQHQSHFCPLRKKKFPIVGLFEDKKIERYMKKCQTFFLKVTDEEIHLVSSGIYITGIGNVKNFIAGLKLEHVDPITKKRTYRKRDSITDGVVVNLDNVKPIDEDGKKKRVRKNKNKEENEPVKKEETPVKKKRGRPRKNPEETITPSPPPLPKKKRGRPRKNA